MLNRKQKYLQIALNSNLMDAHSIINQIPLDERIIIEAGTPLIKAYGLEAIQKIRFWWDQKVLALSSEIPGDSKAMRFSLAGLLVGSVLKSMKERAAEKKKVNSEKNRKIFSPYIVADLKCMDRGEREVEIAQEGGADAAVALGHAPPETLDAFIEECESRNLDSMIDMMNVDFPLNIIRQLKKPPEVVILHRGVDEESFNPESEIPYHEIQRIKSEYDIMVAVAGGDTFQEVQRAVFNDADIVVVWKSFYKSTAETAKLAEEFLKEIR